MKGLSDFQCQYNYQINLHTLVHQIKDTPTLSMLFNEACRTFTHLSNIGHKLRKMTSAVNVRSHLPLLGEFSYFSFKYK